MSNYQNLDVWKLSHEFVLKVYNSTNKFPSIEMYNITSQIRRAAVSIPCNIAEGYGKHSTPEFIRFCQIAKGSATEVEYLLLLSKDLKYFDNDTYEELNSQCTQILKMLSGLIASLKRKH